MVEKKGISRRSALVFALGLLIAMCVVGLSDVHAQSTSVPVYKAWSMPDGSSAMNAAYDTNARTYVQLWHKNPDYAMGPAVELNRNNGWHYVFESDSGSFSDYTVKELRESDDQVLNVGDRLNDNWMLSKQSVGEDGYGTRGQMLVNSSIPQSKPTMTSLPVYKAWSYPNGSSAMDLARENNLNVVVQLYKKDGSEVTGKTLTLNKNNNWFDTFTDLEGDASDYYVMELDGNNQPVEKNGKIKFGSGEWQLTSSYPFKNNWKDWDVRFSLVNTSIPQSKPTTTSIPVAKFWSGPNNTKAGSDAPYPSTLKVQLQKKVNGTWTDVQGQTLTLSKSNNWSDWFMNIPADYNKNDYRVVELKGETPITSSGTQLNDDWKFERSGWFTSYPNGQNVNAYALINTSTPQMTSVPVAKFWSTPFKTSAPASAYSGESVKVGIFKKGSETADETITLDSSNNWSCLFENLPGKFSDYEVYELDAEGKKIEKGGEVGDDWTFTDRGTFYSYPYGDAYYLTNTSKPLTSVPVYKSWLTPEGEAATEHPDSVTVVLKKGEEEIDTQVLNDDNDWHYVFKDLKGKADDYTVEETGLNEKVWNSEVKSENGAKYIINTKINPENINIPVEKKWKNTPESDKVEVTIKLLANGEATDETVTLNADNGWKATFLNLPKTDDEGEEIEYTIEEVSIGEDFTTVPTGDAKEGFTVTNTKKPDEPEIDKKVNGSTHADLAKVDEEFTYTISSKVPNYQADEFIIVDKLEPVLEYIEDSAVVTIGGAAIEDVPFEVDDNTLTWDLKEYCAEHMSEKVEITFKAKIVDGADLTSYIDDNGSLKVPNEATLKLNNESLASDKVTVTPPPDKPDIEKTVTTSKTKSSNSTADAKKNEVFTYNVDTKIPLNMQTMKVIDVMGEALEYVKGTSVVTIGGEKIDLQPTVSGKQLTWDLSSYKKYATKAVHITYKAKFADDATPIQMETGVVNNIGLDINGERVPGNSVTVKTTPKDKPTNPGLEKFVTTEKTDKNNSHGDLAAEDEIFTYTLESSIPKNANQFIIGDELEPVLTYISDSAEVLIDGMVATDVEPKIEGNKIVFDLSAYCASAAGKSVSISFDATIRSGANLSKYMVGGKVQIPNRATYQLDDKVFESNKVTVTPPGRTYDKDKGSKTGDPTMLGLLAVMLLAAAGGAAFVIRRRRQA